MGLSVGKSVQTIAESEEIKKIFSDIDQDKDGQITLKELVAHFKSLGNDNAEKEAKKFFKAADKNKDKVIDYGEFCCIKKVILDIEIKRKESKL